MSRNKKGLLALDYLLALIFLVIFWEIFSRLINKPFFPGPYTAVMAFTSNIGKELGKHLLVSTYRVVLSLVVALLTAVPLGMFLGHNERLDRYAAPLIYLTYPVPKIIFLPILITLFGIGDFSKIFLITIIVFFQVLVTTRDASRQVNKKMIDSVLSLGASESYVYRHVIFPCCLPKILTALRIGLGTAIAVLFFSETVANRLGVGYFILDAWTMFAWDDMFAGIIALGAMGFVLYLVLDWLEKKLCPWEFLS